MKLPHLDELGGRARAACGALREPSSPDAGWAAQIVAPNGGRRIASHVWNQYTVRVTGGRRDALQKYLADRKIGSAIYYPVPLHLQKCFAALGYREGSLPETEQACREVLSLPVYPELTAAEQGAVIDAVAEFCQAKGARRREESRVRRGSRQSRARTDRTLNSGSDSRPLALDSTRPSAA